MATSGGFAAGVGREGPGRQRGAQLIGVQRLSAAMLDKGQGVLCSMGIVPLGLWEVSAGALNGPRQRTPGAQAWRHELSKSVWKEFQRRCYTS